MTDLATTLPSAAVLRDRLADALITSGAISSPLVERAVRTVPREAFVPDGTDLAAAYADDVVITKRGPDGKALSSISAPWLQARMIEQARLQLGARVLEIGSGGYNAALIAEVVGSDGAVTSVDIDPDVVERARAGLARAGYDGVHVVEADGEYGCSANAPYDAIIVTVEASDVPPAWTGQLATDGVLVVPLRMRGNTRSLALTREGDHLVATSVILCGFVPMQGDGRQPEERLPIRGDDIVLRIDDNMTKADPSVLAGAFNHPRLDVWSRVTTPPDVSFESLHLWIASQPQPYGLLAVDRDRVSELDPQNPVACPTLISGGSIAYLAIRKVDDATWQFGAQAYGPDAGAVANDLLACIELWDRNHRRGPESRITVHPAGADPGPGDDPRLAVQRRHTTITITWPLSPSKLSPSRALDLPDMLTTSGS